MNFANTDKPLPSLPPSEVESLDVRVQELQAEKKLLEATIEAKAKAVAKREWEADQLVEAHAKLYRIQQRAAAKEGFPFKFPADSTPLKDLQIAYRYVPTSVLPTDQVELLDQAVEKGDIATLIDTFRELANRPENIADMLLKALQNKASEHEESPNAYLNDTMRYDTQKALAIGIMWHLV
ncbi:hypothetical protein BDR26DRAFT_1012249 [Obelidium mucronatum]|nr:hypothetical protein BDR26DRAFT_1012249 [Obelidium mucronatum]